ncbi:MAG: PAS domain-containing protein [Thalassobaculum sp.]|uniref:PAS domain-containing protein n=1 Tax=Thalassobaculum sp. TaxID=2022740 RepID=UPI0032EBF70E
MAKSDSGFLPAECDSRIRAVVEYWSGLPAGPIGVPMRRDFDPLDLPVRLLPHVWMVDAEREPARFRFRLCGSHLVEALGFNPTGRYYDEVFPDFASTATFAALTRVRETGQGSWRSGDPNLTFPNHDIRALERTFLPLTSDGRRIDIVLAASIYRGRSGRPV